MSGEITFYPLNYTPFYTYPLNYENAHLSPFPSKLLPV